MFRNPKVKFWVAIGAAVLAGIYFGDKLGLSAKLNALFAKK